MNKFIGITGFIVGFTFGAGITLYEVGKFSVNNPELRKAVNDIIYRKIDGKLFGERTVDYEEVC